MLANLYAIIEEYFIYSMHKWVSNLNHFQNIQPINLGWRVWSLMVVYRNIKIIKVEILFLVNAHFGFNSSTETAHISPQHTFPLYKKG